MLRPAPNRAAVNRHRMRATASAQNAAAGASLITDLLITSPVGLVATSHAAARPTASDPSLRPIMKVAHTRSAPLNGTTQNIAQCPATALNAAIIIGSPGAVTGTIACRSVVAR